MSDKDFIVKNSIVANGTFKANSTAVYLGDIAGQYATANSTKYTGTANNTDYVGVTAAADVANSTTLAANLVNYARLSNLNDSTPAIFTQNVEIRSSTLVINTSSKVIAGGSPGTLNQALLSTVTGVKWASLDSVSLVAPGACNQLIMNKAGAFQGASGLLYDDSSNTLSVGNSTIVATINSTVYSGTANNSNYLGTVAADQYQLNSTLAANVAWMTSLNSLNLNGVSATNYVTTTGEKTITNKWTFAGGANLAFSNGDITRYLFVNTTNGYWTGYAADVVQVAGRDATTVVVASQLAANLSNYAPKSKSFNESGQYVFQNQNYYSYSGLFNSNVEIAILGESAKEHGVYGITYNILHDVNDASDPHSSGEGINLNRFGCGVIGEVRSDSANSIGVFGIGNNGPGVQGASNRNHGMVSYSKGNNQCWGIISNCDPYSEAYPNLGYSSPDSSGKTAGGLLAVSNTSTAIAGTSKTGWLLDLFKRDDTSKMFRVYNDGSVRQSGGLDIDGNVHISFNYISSSERQIKWNFTDYGSVYFYGRQSDKVLGLYDSSTNANRWSTDPSGNFTARGNVAAYSDIKLKKDITTIDNALDKVSKMRGVMFTRKDTDVKSTGVIAQEMQQVLPEVVSTDSEGTLNVAYGNIVGVLIEAIKELKAEIEQLKGK